MSDGCGWVSKNDFKLLSQWYWIMPNIVLFSNELSDKQKLLYCLISSLCAEKWYCRASNEYLWELLKADKRTISRNISELHDKWFISVEINNNSQRTITLDKKDNTIDKNVVGDGQKCPGEDRQKCLHNITTTNTTIEKLFSAYYWKRKWIDDKICTKLINTKLEQWITLDDINNAMVLYNCEWRIKQDWQYVKKFETRIKEFQPIDEEWINEQLKIIARLYKNKLNADVKFQNSKIAKETWEELTTTFWEQKIREIWKSEWRKQIALNLN